MMEGIAVIHTRLGMEYVIQTIWIVFVTTMEKTVVIQEMENVIHMVLIRCVT